MVCLGAATAGNCIPCFDYYYQKAKACGLAAADIQDAVGCAYKIKNNVNMLMKTLAAPAIDLAGVQALLFTSANGVRCFAAANQERDLKVFAVGDASATTARELGFTAVKSATGDVDSLAALVADRLKPIDGALLHAAGTSLAGDLKGQLETAGFTVKRVALYDAVPATDLSPSTLMNLRLGGIDAIALFSPRSARTFVQLWRWAQQPDALGHRGARGLGHPHGEGSARSTS